MWKWLGALLIAAGLGAWMFMPRPAVTYPPGMVAPEQPIQLNLPSGSGPVFTHDQGYTIQARAEYLVRARVLGKKRYRFDQESALAPYDFALGWGPMSNQTLLNHLSFSQSGRWYFWYADTLPTGESAIMDNSANTHLIPADDDVLDKLNRVREGELVELDGYLVRVTGPGGWRWDSSMSRTDRGDGACEVMYVREVYFPETPAPAR